MFLNHTRDFATATPAFGRSPDALFSRTRVETLNGWRAVGQVTAGTRLFTYDGGIARVAKVETLAGPNDAIRIPARAFGADHETYLSPGQLVLLETGAAMPWLNVPVALARAEDLIGLKGVARRKAPETRLTRLVLEDEQILFASTGLCLFAGSSATQDTSECYPVLTRDEARDVVG